MDDVLCGKIVLLHNCSLILYLFQDPTASAHAQTQRRTWYLEQYVLMHVVQA